MRITITSILLVFTIFTSFGQDIEDTLETTIDSTETSEEDFEIQKMKIKGKVYSVLITEGDTMVIADLDYINISSIRLFSNEFEKKKYFLFKKHSRNVYDYAQGAIQIYREYEYAKSQNMSKRALKKSLND